MGSNQVQFEFIVDETPLTKAIEAARNEISKVADSMNEMVRTANERLDEAAQQFNKIGDSADQGGQGIENLNSKVGGLTKSLIGLAAGVFAIKKLIDAFTWLYDVTNTQADAENKLEHSLKQTGNAAGYSAQQIKDFAAARQQITKFGDEATIAAASIASSFKNLHGETFLKTIELSQDLATHLGTDLSSATKKLAAAINDPIKGMKALESEIGSLSIAEQKLITDLVETGKVAEAQQILIDKLTSSIGGNAEAAANTFSGSLQQIQNRIGDIGEIVGGAFGSLATAMMPFLDEMVSIFETTVIPAVENFGEIIESLQEPVLSVLENISDVWINIFGNIYDNVMRMYDAIKQALMPVFGELGISVTSLTDIYNKAATVIGTVIGTAFTVLTDIIVGVVIPAFSLLYDGVKVCFDAMIPLVKPVVTTIGNALVGLVTVIEKVANAVGWLFGNDLMGTKLVQTAKEAGKYIADAFNDVSSTNRQRTEKRKEPKQEKQVERPETTFESQVDTTNNRELLEREKEAERLNKLDEKYALDLSKFKQDEENKLNALKTKHIIQNKNTENKSIEEQEAIRKRQLVEEQALMEEQLVLKEALQKEYEANRRNASELELQDIRNQTAKALSDIKNESSLALNDTKYEKPEKEEKSRVGNVEGLEDTYKRISQAINQREPEDETSKKVEDLTKQEKVEMDKQNKILEKVNDGVGSLLTPLENMLRKLDGVGGLA